MARILIVDDDLNTCQSLTAALSKEGHQVFEAHSGKEALEKIRISRSGPGRYRFNDAGHERIGIFSNLESPAPGSGRDYDFRPGHRGVWR